MGLYSMEEVAALPTRALEARGISADLAHQYGVKVEHDASTGAPSCYYFPLWNSGKLVGYQGKPVCAPGQRESVDKPFRVGETKGCEPFGSKVAGDGGKMLIVTEGAEDCLAMRQMLKEAGRNYRVVATLGTGGWKQQMEYFAGYENVFIAFDMDKAGLVAGAEFAAALKPGQAKLMTWPNKYKDPNDLLVQGRGKHIIDLIHNAKPYKPDGVLVGEDMWAILENYVSPEAVPYPPEFSILQAKMQGIRAGEISLWTAGTGIGKTSFIRRTKQHIITTTDWPVGEVELEEQSAKTGRGMLEFQGKKRLKDMTPAEKRAAYDATYGTGRLITLSHRSQYTKGQSLLGKFQHLHHAHGVKIIYLDHITLAVSEYGDGNGGLSNQDKMMNDFLGFVESTNVHLSLISHIRKPPSGGKAWAQGAIPTEEDLKGSGSLSQIPFDIIAVSRNKQHTNDYIRNTSLLTCLKCREEGDTGPCDMLYWDNHSRQLVTAEYMEDADE